MDQQTRQSMILEHLEAIRQLQTPDPGGETVTHAWPPSGYYLLWHVLVGMMLGFIGAAVSLAANAIGAPLAGEQPLQLIRVYLTFPMGEQALVAASGQVLTVGCILYLVTGGLYGIAFHLMMSTLFARTRTINRFLIGSALGLGLWIVNFYLILSWLQPLLLGGRWILDLVPWWVAALTHLAFAWTMLLVEQWGQFDFRAHAKDASPSLSA